MQNNIWYKIAFILAAAKNACIKYRLYGVNALSITHDFFYIYKSKMVATLVISLDTELAWGAHDKKSYKHLTDWHINRRNITGMLHLFEQYNIPVTWAVVGHLFLNGCSGHSVSNYPDKWFDEDPKGKFNHNTKLWYGPDIIEMIVNSCVDHEIGLHSFSHIIFDKVTSDIAHQEMVLAMDAAKSYGLHPISFVFPREAVDHLDILKEHGIKIFRRPGVGIEANFPLPRKLRKFIRECFFPYPGSISQFNDEGGIFSVTSSTNLCGWGLLQNGQKHLYQVLKFKKIDATLKKAIKLQSMVHLDAHPHNFQDESDLMYLDRVLSLIARYRECGVILTETMGEVYRRLAV